MQFLPFKSHFKVEKKQKINMCLLYIYNCEKANDLLTTNYKIFA